ncbi:MAG: methyltransferase domain-containing protein [Clostridia bacterium]
MKSEWNPGLYMKFQDERTLPARDLISRIALQSPKRILDVGCGPGNSTSKLREKWGSAEIIGIDNSKTMLEKARLDCPDSNFILMDANGDLSGLGTFDIIFSNAALQWMPGHHELLNKLIRMLNKGGVMAAQIPNSSAMPIQTSIMDAAKRIKWRRNFTNFSNGLNMHEPGYYYEILSCLKVEFTLWETHYHHVMENHRSIIEWYESTGMKPYLDRLPENMRGDFKTEVLELIKKRYPMQSDGRILFPFRRVFFTAVK